MANIARSQFLRRGGCYARCWIKRRDVDGSHRADDTEIERAISSKSHRGAAAQVRLNEFGSLQSFTGCHANAPQTRDTRTVARKQNPLSVRRPADYFLVRRVCYQWRFLAIADRH